MNKDRLKFRVWDEGHQKYWYEGMLLDNDGGIITTNCDDGSLPEIYGDTIIEQCTGLKDKNGNLIYEGDILNYEIVGGRKLNEKHTVVWKVAAFFHEAEDKSAFMLHPESTQYAEVVGNIHEGVKK